MELRDDMHSKSAYEIIRGWIFENKLKPGEKLSERSMAESIGLSRVPIREAFQRLTLEGLLVNNPGKGLCLRSYNEQDIAALYMYREALDGMAARMFTIRADSIEKAYLLKIFKEMKATVAEYHPRYWDQKDIEFHMIIARGARNERILSALESVLLECIYLSKIFNTKQSTPTHLNDVIEEHNRIFEAVSTGDADLAEKVARESVRDGLERVLKAFIAYNRPAVVKPEIKES
jgi:DNA-binding GntR family transcriptional regulator